MRLPLDGPRVSRLVVGAASDPILVVGASDLIPVGGAGGGVRSHIRSHTNKDVVQLLLFREWGLCDGKAISRLTQRVPNNR